MEPPEEFAARRMAEMNARLEEKGIKTGRFRPTAGSIKVAQLIRKKAEEMDEKERIRRIRAAKVLRDSWLD